MSDSPDGVGREASVTGASTASPKQVPTASQSNRLLVRMAEHDAGWRQRIAVLAAQRR